MRADQHFTEIKLKQFIQTIIKNAKQRAATVDDNGKQRRASSGRNRIAKKNIKKLVHTEEIVPESDEEIPCTPGESSE